MKGHYTAVVKQEGDWWIGWIEEVPGGELPGTHTRGAVGKPEDYPTRGLGV